MKTINRTIKTATVNCLCADVEAGDVVNRYYRMPPCGKEKALKVAKKMEQDESIKPVQVVSISVDEVIASAPLEDFLKIAEITPVNMISND